MAPRRASEYNALSSGRSRELIVELPILHPLTASFLELLLSLALACAATFGSWTSHSGHALSSSSEGSVSQIGRVCRNDQVKPPCPVTQHCGESETAVSPIQDVPEELRQPLGVKVFAALPQVAWLGAKDGAANLLEPELDEQRGRGEEDVEQEGAPREAAAEEECPEEAEEEVHGKREQAALVELGGIARSLRLCCFLSHVA